MSWKIKFWLPLTSDNIRKWHKSLVNDSTPLCVVAEKAAWHSAKTVFHLHQYSRRMWLVSWEKTGKAQSAFPEEGRKGTRWRPSEICFLSAVHIFDQYKRALWSRHEKVVRKDKKLLHPSSSLPSSLVAPITRSAYPSPPFTLPLSYILKKSGISTRVLVCSHFLLFCVWLCDTVYCTSTSIFLNDNFQFLKYSTVIVTMFHVLLVILQMRPTPQYIPGLNKGYMRKPLIKRRSSTPSGVYHGT